MKKNISTILLVLTLVIGLSLLLYPSFSDWWNSFHQSRAILSYGTAVKAMTQTDYDLLFQEAEDYNRKLSQISFPLMHFDRAEGYEAALDPGGDGILGYVEIPKLEVSLPIYHGTSDAVLQVAVGHLEGTSLPTGGAGTHCVLSAHRGLPSARLFTDLDKLEIGDRFTLTVLDREMTYEVDQIQTVEPTEVENLYMVEGKDLCTLMTCTPYGINTHRLLVRGARVAVPEVPEKSPASADAWPLPLLSASVILAAPVLLGMLAALVIPRRRK